MKLNRTMVAGPILMSGSTAAHQPDWSEEVCQSKYVKLFLEDRKELWSGELETEMKAITLTGVRDAYMGRIFVHQSPGRGKVYWRTVEGEGKFYWIPSDQYAMLEHCFSYPPYFGN